MATTRKPMTFDIEKPAPATSAPTPPAQAVQARPAASSAAALATPDEMRRSIGARVPIGLYRQAKAQAALSGTKVQDLVEQALREYLAKPARS
jgi:hypothetical protein